MSLYIVKPLDDVTIFTTPQSRRKPVPFKASWATTREDLARELRLLDATDAVLELAVQPRHVRQDGQLRSDVPKDLPHPGVRLSYVSKAHGALSHTCDTYEARWQGQMADWQANLRAIVLTMESLRAIDRHGATKGEQYAGFKALGAGSGATPMGAEVAMTRQQAYAVLYSAAGETDGTETEAKLYRKARSAAHPDRHNGDRTLWNRVEEAGLTLGVAR